MPEGLSPADNERAKQFYADHREVSKDLQPEIEKLDQLRAGELRIANNPAMPDELATDARANAAQTDRELFSRITVSPKEKRNFEDQEDLRDANLWRAEQHSKQNQEGYVEQAKQEAEADGVKINLGDQPDNEKPVA